MYQGLQLTSALVFLLYLNPASNASSVRPQATEDRSKLHKSSAGKGFQARRMPGKNLFGQPAETAACMVKEIVWEGEDTKSTFYYNDRKQLIRHVETGGINTNIEYNNKGRISRITGLETLNEMKLVYDDEDKLSAVYVRNNSGNDKATIKYKGDKIVEVEYADFLTTYYFDANYNLVRAVIQSRDVSLSKEIVEAVIEIMKEHKHFLLGTGDFRFIVLLYGDYIGEGGYSNASINYFKKYTVIDNSTGTPASDSHTAEVQTANLYKFPTSVLFKFDDAQKNFRIKISYDCP